MCKCQAIHEIDAQHDAVWRNRAIPLEDRIRRCLLLHEQSLRLDEELFGQPPKEGQL